MGLRFEHPAWLWLLLLAIPAAWLGVRWFASMSRVRRWTSVATRVSLIALVTAMLAGASAVRRTDKVVVVGVVDVSDSVRLFGTVGTQDTPVQAAKKFLASAQRHRGADDLLGVVAFDGKAAAVVMPTRGDLAERSIDQRLADGTDIAAGLRQAAAMIPPDATGRIILFSDGLQTTGDALTAAREVGRGLGRSTPIDVVPVMLDATREVMLESVDAPPRAAAGATVTVRITLRSTGPATGTLQLTREGEVIDLNGEEPGAGRRLSLDEGRHVELVTVPLPPGRLHRFDAVFIPDQTTRPDGESQPIADTRAENNRASALTVSAGKGSVLLVDGVNVPGGPGGGGILARTLKESDIDVTVVPPEAIPDNLLALQAYDLVILENVPAESVSQPAQRSLVSYVKDTGGGLVMVGGPDSLGAGGWKGSEIEPLLPVKLDLPEKLVQPDAAVILVLDNSGSMGRDVMGSVHTQQQIANQAASLAVKTLDKKDLVGVIVFNSTTSVIVPLGPNTDPKATAAKIMGIGPNGGTVMGPALAEAGSQIGKARAAVKHIIVLSDGRSAGFQALPQLAERIHVETGAMISTISVGDSADEQTMGDIADRGGGKSYIVTNPSLLPKFFLKAVRVIRTPLIRQAVFQPRIEATPSPLTAGISNPPRLLGLVLTQRRPEATITYAMSAAGGEPLLAHWNVDLGQVGVFASDAGQWARDWLPWPGYRQLWTQVVRSLSRATPDTPYELTVEPEDDGLRLRLEASNAEGRPLEGLTVPAVIHGPSGTQSTLTLTQTGPGVYEGKARTQETGAHIAVVKPALRGKPVAGVIGGASVSSGVEFRRLTTDMTLLEQIARESKGRVLSFGDADTMDPFERSGLEAREGRSPLWRLLLLWTLIVFLADVGMRRIAWDRFVSREFGVDVKKAASEVVADRGRQATRSVDRLRMAADADRIVPRPAVELSDRDAEAVAEAEQERRRAAQMARLQALRQQQTQAADAAGPDRGSSEQALQDRPAPEEPSGLMAAKRRAREQMERADDGEQA